MDYLVGPAREHIRPRIEGAAVDLNVPALCEAEVVSALRRLVRRGELTRGSAREALTVCLELPLVRHELPGLLHRALSLEGFSAYDALYVALAERLGAALLTTDARLRRGVEGAAGLGVPLA